jgi:hypothetical protein
MSERRWFVAVQQSTPKINTKDKDKSWIIVTAARDDEDEMKR